MRSEATTSSGNLIADLQKSEVLRVHSIETFGTHDGPGIRLVIFVQGCQFHCVYCANPDSISIEGGTLMKIDEIVEKAKKQKPFFGKNGGVTISGGEPLLQRANIKKLFHKLHEEGIHTTLDTNGKVIDKQSKNLLENTDLVMLDIKHINDDWHHKITRLSNSNTLKFAEYRESTGKPMWLRYVLVPGWSDQEEYLHQLGEHFKDYQSIQKIEILPYHKLGMHKWEALGWKYELEDVKSPDKTTIEKAAQIFRQYFKEVTVG